MIRLYILVAVVILLSGVLVTGTCMSREEKPQPFLICWSYDTSGYLEICGCSSHQRGGLARRASKIAALREKQPVLLIEGAHFVADAGEFQLFKGETVVRALNIMEYDAVILGYREAQHGRDALDTINRLSDAPCISANLQIDGEPWEVAYETINIGGLCVGITGVSQPESINFELPDGVSFGDAKEGLRQALADLSSCSDIQVVCLEGEETWIRGMMQKYSSSADLFLSGNRSEAAASLDFTSDPPRLNNWELGKYLGVVAVDPGEDSSTFAGTNVPIEDTLPEDERIVAMLDNDYRAHLKDRFFTKMKVDLEQMYMPPMACAQCHPDETSVYEQSAHATALDTLAEAGDVYNPECMSCHIVYDPGQDELQSINCIVCHSNIGEQHIWDAVEGNVVRPEEPVTAYSYESCATCHNELNSLPFLEHWPQYVNKVFHGGDDSEARAAAERMGIEYTDDPPDISSH